jgi:hypothetical protein
MSQDSYTFRLYSNCALGVRAIIRLSHLYYSYAKLCVFVCVSVCPTVCPNALMFLHLSHSYPSLPSGSRLSTHPPTNPATWSLPALQLTVDRANVLLLRRTLNVHTAPSEGNKNMKNISCFLEKSRKTRDWGGKRVGLRHAWTCIWHISCIWADWLSSLLTSPEFLN